MNFSNQVENLCVFQCFRYLRHVSCFGIYISDTQWVEWVSEAGAGFEEKNKLYNFSFSFYLIKVGERERDVNLNAKQTQNVNWIVFWKEQRKEKRRPT